MGIKKTGQCVDCDWWFQVLEKTYCAIDPDINSFTSGEETPFNFKCDTWKLNQPDNTIQEEE